VIPALCLVAASFAAGAAPPADTTRQTQNVILVTLDGFRWQELFSGADSSLLASIADSTTQAKTRAGFWRPDPVARRAALLPWLWSTIPAGGQLFGNRYEGGAVRVTNGKRFSYPGYNEILSGFPDDRIDSNDPVPNPNVTVLEWLNREPAFAGRVAAFGAWSTFTAIINAPRSGLPVNAGWMPVEGTSPAAQLLNQLQDYSTRTWDEERDDAITWLAAKQYLVTRTPRVFYLAFGDTDEWAHGGRYDTYLDMAHRTDAMLRDLWEMVQSLPQYRGHTSLVIATDHGRGDGPGWTDHGKSVPEAEFIWIAVMGPDTPARGLRNDVTAGTQSQIAATIAALLGYDYPAAVPKAGPVLPLGSIR
jgi:hypothetical protein